MSFILDYKEIVKEVSGQFASGQLVGVLGPSGNEVDEHLMWELMSVTMTVWWCIDDDDCVYNCHNDGDDNEEI